MHLRAEAFTQSPDGARAITDKLALFIALTRTAETSVGTRGTDADVKAFFDSLKIRQDNDRAVLTASVPFGFLRKMLSGIFARFERTRYRLPAQPAAKSH